MAHTGNSVRFVTLRSQAWRSRIAFAHIHTIAWLSVADDFELGDKAFVNLCGECVPSDLHALRHL